MTSNITDFIRSKAFRRNIIGALVLFVLLFFGLNIWLGSYTKHGETIIVPQLKGLSMEKTEKTLKEAGLAFEIVDSLYELGKSPGTVIEQDPASKTLVKMGRTIYLTVNASKPPKVKVTPQVTA